MSWNVLDNISYAGSGQQDFINTLAAPSNSYPIFWALVVLVPFFLILLSSTFFRQKDREGRANIWSSLAVSGFATSLVAIAMNLFSLIDRVTLSWVLGVSGFLIALFILIGKPER
jgi:O-antigen/teichoic acid export membrane protein